MSKRLSLAQRVESVMDARAMAASSAPAVLMVSGGSDSTALAYLASDMVARGRLGAAAILHVNHHLRGAASDGDARFVSHLAEHLAMPLFMCDIDIAGIVARTGGNMEAVAREERYRAAREALESMCNHLGYSFSDGRVFTAHTADDRVENFYMRSIVGTGPGGFRAMRHSVTLQGCCVCRPLLEEGRDDLRSYIEAREDAVVDEAGARWREDATNADTDRFRAFVRHEIVPLAKHRNPALLETLTRTMNLIADEDDMLDSRARELASAFVVPLGDNPADGVLVSPALCEQEAPLVRRVLAIALSAMLPADARVETASIDACMKGLGSSGYVANIQGNMAVSYNKCGLRIEPMRLFRMRRKLCKGEGKG